MGKIHKDDIEYVHVDVIDPDSIPENPTGRFLSKEEIDVKIPPVIDDYDNSGCTLTILDTITKKQIVVESKFNTDWWACGNGSCDCNRSIEMGIWDELDKKQHNEHPELKEWQNLCFGYKRFLIIKSDSDEYSLDGFNSDYPDELKEEFLKR